LEAAQVTCDVAVIGAGVFGSWTAWHLRRAGKTVLLLDAWGPAHSRASSGDETRVIRMGYGADVIYTHMAQRSLTMWQELFERARQPLFHRTGVLWMGRTGEPYSESTVSTLSAAGVPTQILSAAELSARYPQMVVPGPGAFGIFEPASGALMARRAVAAVVADSGADYERQWVQPPNPGGVWTAAGSEIRARQFVFACGPWLPKLFPDLLGQRIFPTRQEVFYFAPPPGDSRFAAPQLPVWIDFTDPRGPYGFPDIESRGFKLALDRHGPPFDPDSGDRRPSEQGLADARRFLAERFPVLADAPLNESRVCQYENTSSGDFLLDRHPLFENIWLAGGGSGHGFKHGPAVGEYLAGRILRDAAPEPRFSLAAKQDSQHRTVF
jgi:monomeric sarcosine oxidase